MSHTVGSVTILVRRLKAGSHTALAAIAGRFLGQQERFAAELLGRTNPGSDGPDDVAAQVLHRLWNESQRRENVWTYLTDTGSLMATLDMLTRQGVMRVREFNGAQRRSGQTVRDADCLETIAARAPGLTDGQFAELTEGLTDRQKLIAQLRDAGWFREELPARIGCSLSTISRELKVIQRKLRS